MEVAGLRADRSPGGADLSWTNSGLGVQYDVIIGTLDAFQAGQGISSARCLRFGLTSPSVTDGTLPPEAGVGAFYLVRGVNVCGDGPYWSRSGTNGDCP